jgi:hypothetical protein
MLKKLKSIFEACTGLINNGITQTYALTNIAPETANQNITELKDALSKLNQLRTGKIHAVHHQEAETILDWVSANARSGIAQNMGLNLETDTLMDTCGIISSIANKTLNQELGLPTVVVNIGKIGNTEDRHTFLTVTFPIQENDTTNDKVYLIDLSYRQFVDPPNQATPNCTKVEDLPGYWLSRTEDGTQLGTQLLTKGYCQLDETLAKHYVEAFNRNKPAFKTAEKYLQEITNSNYHHDDFTTEELEKRGYNVKAPLPLETPTMQTPPIIMNPIKNI